jgi:YceI-like domain
VRKTNRIGVEGTAITSFSSFLYGAGLVGALGMLLVLVTRADATAAVETPGLVFAPGASLELFGDSTLHHYTVKASGMTVGVGVDPAPRAAGAKSRDLEALVRSHFIKTFALTVPVAKLSSGEKGLDANLRKALKGDQYKDILFRMESYDVLAPAASGATFALVLHGRLSLAGVERKIDVDAAGTRVGAGLKLTGSKDLLMTDYQIKPPTLMLGTIKTANLITVKFNATLQNGQSP